MRMSQRADRSESGASGVIVVMLVTVFMALTAISVEYAQLVSYRVEAQNAADSAALALAQSCEVDSRCPRSSAQWMVTQNASGATLTSGVTARAWDEVELTVEKQADLLFAQVFDRDRPGSSTRTVRATARVEWGDPIINGENVFPFGIGICQWNSSRHLSSIQLDFRESWGSAIPRDSCSVPSFGTGRSPSGFRMIIRDGAFRPETCRITTLRTPTALFLNGTFNTGSPPPPSASCAAMMTSLSVGDRLLLPVYSVRNIISSRGEEMRVVGLTPFEITGFVDGTGAAVSTCDPGIRMNPTDTNDAQIIFTPGSCRGVIGSLAPISLDDPDMSVVGDNWERGSGPVFGTARAKLIER